MEIDKEVNKRKGNAITNNTIVQNKIIDEDDYSEPPPVVTPDTKKKKRETLKMRNGVLVLRSNRQSG